ncbi:MAG TPA: hypothetical protein VET90_10370, partial [Candidatus Binatus sp.]|nr:hypothetical protein [Candidatus Binatus sp.]
VVPSGWGGPAATPGLAAGSGSPGGVPGGQAGSGSPGLTFDPALFALGLLGFGLLGFVVGLALVAVRRSRTPGS